jgi:hypothetical protein
MENHGGMWSWRQRQGRYEYRFGRLGTRGRRVESCCAGTSLAREKTLVWSEGGGREAACTWELQLPPGREGHFSYYQEL